MAFLFPAQGIGAGLGAGIVYVPSVAVVAHYLPKRRALAMSIVASGIVVLAVLYGFCQLPLMPPLVAFLTEDPTFRSVLAATTATKFTMRLHIVEGVVPVLFNYSVGATALNLTMRDLSCHYYDEGKRLHHPHADVRTWLVPNSGEPRNEHANILQENPECITSPTAGGNHRCLAGIALVIPVMTLVCIVSGCVFDLDRSIAHATHSGGLFATVRSTVCLSVPPDPLPRTTHMSEYPQGTPVDPSGLGYATFYFDHRIYRCFFLAGFTILIYDHLLTLGTEANYIWSRRLRPSTCWFLLVRYAGLSASITIFVFYFGDLSHERSVTSPRGWEALLVLQERRHARSARLRYVRPQYLDPDLLVERWGANLTNVLGIAQWAIAKYGHPQMLSAPGLSGCHTAIPRSSAFRLAGAWEAQLVCDTMVFALTVRRAYVQRTSPLYTGSLIQKMLTDGGMYFGIIVIANLANLLTFYIGDILLSGFLSWFTTSLSVTLLSRLMLNLHEAAGIAFEDEGATAMELDSLRFQTVLSTANEANVERDDLGPAD
ncbi:hypothetical protein B0H13DRAFT_2322457 [Mycena leptocephala]|nr:hypothetical protein B0H13DRAFT_2322457 [Mycena leptocephala]